MEVKEYIYLVLLMGNHYFLLAACELWDQCVFWWDCDFWVFCVGGVSVCWWFWWRVQLQCSKEFWISHRVAIRYVVHVACPSYTLLCKNLTLNSADSVNYSIWNLNGRNYLYLFEFYFYGFELYWADKEKYQAGDSNWFLSFVYSCIFKFWKISNFMSCM